MKRLILLLPCFLYGAAPDPKKYTAEQLKAIKPPLTAQLHNQLPKAPYVRDPFSPTPKPKKLAKFLAAPHNSPEFVPKKPPIPMEDIVLKFEEFKPEKK
jgi:hypothetical protein